VIEFPPSAQASREPRAGIRQDAGSKFRFLNFVEETMSRSKMWQWMRLCALAAVFSMAMGSVAWGYDNDDYYNRHDEAREHGFQNGYRDGSRAGQNDVERGRRFKFKNDDWEDSRGYEHWMGDHGNYKRAYRDGYERGYRRAYGYEGSRSRDRDDYRRYDRDRDRDDWR
jgi:hypothetical protein